MRLKLGCNRQYPTDQIAWAVPMTLGVDSGGVHLKARLHALRRQSYCAGIQARCEVI